MREPIYHGLLQDPLDCDGHPIIGIPSESTKEVWITNVARNDAANQTGTRTNPFDGSTQPKLDAIFQAYFDAGTTDIVFHLSPGTFYLIGGWDGAWGLLDGWHIKGAGKTVTRIVQVVGTLGAVEGDVSGALFREGISQIYDNQSVEDLWCDGAYFRSGPVADGGDGSREFGIFAGVSLYGENCVVRNVRVTGFGYNGAVTAKPAYGVIISGGITDQHLPHSALIENCEFYDEGGLNSIPLFMLNNAALDADVTPTYANNGRMIGNTVNCPAAGGCGIPEGFAGGAFSQNKIITYFAAIRHYLARSGGVHINGNDLNATFEFGYGIVFFGSTAGQTSLLIYDNVIRSASGIVFLANVVNTTVARNRLSLYGASANTSWIDLESSTVQNIAVIDNVSQTGTPYINTGTSGCWFRGNRSTAGSVTAPDTEPDVPITLFVSQLYGDDTSGARLKSGLPFLTINAAIAAASFGDTVNVIDGTFNECLLSKNGVNVRFEPQARLYCTSAAGCIKSNGTSHTFAVFHEHVYMFCSTASAPGILVSHDDCNFLIHGDIQVTGTSGDGVKMSAAASLELWGNVTSASGIGVNGAAAANTTLSDITVHGNVTATAGYATKSLGGFLRIRDGKVTGNGTSGAILINANDAYQIFDNCTIVAGDTSKVVVAFGSFGAFVPIFRDCVLVAGSFATATIVAGSAQSILLYGQTVANKGANPPANVTFVAGTYAVSAGVISDR